MKYLFLLSAVFILEACSTPLGGSKIDFDARTANTAPDSLISLSPEAQWAIVSSPDDSRVFCFLPPPEGLKTSSSSIVVSGISAGGVAPGAGTSSGADIVGGLNPNVHIIREMFFRTCEMIVNYNLPKDEALDLFKATLARIPVTVSLGTGVGTAVGQSPSEPQ